MKKTLLAICFIFIAIGAIAVGSYSLYRSSLFNLQKISYVYSVNDEKADGALSGYVEFLKPQIENYLSQFVGKSIWDIDIFEVEKSLESQSWVRNVVISRQFPSELFVKVEPKKVIANILKSPSKVQPVAVDSSLLPYVDISKAPLVPILSGKAFIKSDDLRKKALRFLQEIPQEGSFGYDQISEVYPFKNDEFQVLLKNSKALVLINSDDIPVKAARISRVIDYMDPSEMKGRVIDSNFSKKVLVRARNHR